MQQQLHTLLYQSPGRRLDGQGERASTEAIKGLSTKPLPLAASPFVSPGRTAVEEDFEELYFMQKLGLRYSSSRMRL